MGKTVIRTSSLFSTPTSATSLNVLHPYSCILALSLENIKTSLSLWSFTFYSLSLGLRNTVSWVSRVCAMRGLKQRGRANWIQSKARKKHPHNSPESNRLSSTGCMAVAVQLRRTYSEYESNTGCH